MNHIWTTCFKCIYGFRNALRKRAMILTTFRASACFRMKMLRVLCDIGPNFQMLLRLASIFRGFNVLKSLHRLLTIGFVEVDRVMCCGETKSVFGNEWMKVTKMNLCLFDGDVWKKLVVTDVKMLFLTAGLSPQNVMYKDALHENEFVQLQNSYKFRRDVWNIQKTVKIVVWKPTNNLFWTRRE